MLWNAMEYLFWKQMNFWLSICLLVASSWDLECPEWIPRIQWHPGPRTMGTTSSALAKAFMLYLNKGSPTHGDVHGPTKGDMMGITWGISWECHRYKISSNSCGSKAMQPIFRSMNIHNYHVVWESWPTYRRIQLAVVENQVGSI